MTHQLGPDPGLFVELAEAWDLDAEGLYAALGEPGPDIPSGVWVSLADLWGGLSLWLALAEPRLARLAAIGAAADRGLIPALLTIPGYAGTVGLLDAQGLAALVRAPGQEHLGEAETFELAARVLGGHGGEEPARRLVDHLQAWEANGRPLTADLRLTAHAVPAIIEGRPDAIIDKHHNRLALSWLSSDAH